MANRDRSVVDIEAWTGKLADDLRDNSFGSELRVLTASVRADGQSARTLVLEVEYTPTRGGSEHKYIFRFPADELFGYVSEALEAFDDPKFPEETSGASVVMLLLVESLMTNVWSTSEPNYIDIR